jgi:hypothetical protein
MVFHPHDLTDSGFFCARQPPVSFDGGTRCRFAHIVPTRLASAIAEKFTLTSSGACEPATEGSTKKIASTATHAGITQVMRNGFRGC